jgi:hypothetical protein
LIATASLGARKISKQRPFADAFDHRRNTAPMSYHFTQQSLFTGISWLSYSFEVDTDIGANIISLAREQPMITPFSPF